MLEKEKKRDKLNKPMWIFALYPILPGGIKEIQIRDLGSPLDPVAKRSQIALSILRIFSFKEDPRDYRPYTSWHPAVEDWCWNQLLMTTTKLICFHKKQQDIKKHFRLAESANGLYLFFSVRHYFRTSTEFCGMYQLRVDWFFF